LQLELSERVDEDAARKELAEAIQRAKAGEDEVKKLSDAVGRAEAAVREAGNEHAAATNAVNDAVAKQAEIFEAAASQGHTVRPDDAITLLGLQPQRPATNFRALKPRCKPLAASWLPPSGISGTRKLALRRALAR
jgi:hypothetical protein